MTRPLNRRRFLSRSAAASALVASHFTRHLLAEPVPPAETATLSISKTKSATMPLDFTGLSYEMPQLYNPNYFSASNISLIKAFKDLSPNGVLRLGGNLSDVARWNGPNGDFATPKQTAGIEHGKSYWEWKLTDPSVRAGLRDNKDGAITPDSVRNLRAFLDATKWRLIYGFNFGCGSPERAADEGAFVAEAMGDRLVAFQVGNEADFFAGNPWFRTKAYNYDEYLAGYKSFVAAVRAKVPNATFSGPDTANNMTWVDNFATTQARDVKFISSHFYAMGPAKDPAKNAELLLSRSPGLEKQIEQVRKTLAHSVVDGSGPGFRMTEGNSCYGGGKPDVSDAFVSALWGADYMLTVAQAGYLGVNLHGGGDGVYTPIAVGDGLSTELRPIYFGMQFAQQFAGCDLLQCKLDTEVNVTAYAGMNSSTGAQQMALINKSDNQVRVSLPRHFGGKKTCHRKVLSAPSLESKTDVRFAEDARPTIESVETVPAYTAIMLSWKSA